eukprot:6189724-Pleurochrysis_carterae.AAC.1
MMRFAMRAQKAANVVRGMAYLRGIGSPFQKSMATAARRTSSGLAVASIAGLHARMPGFWRITYAHTAIKWDRSWKDTMIARRAENIGAGELGTENTTRFEQGRRGM